MAFRHIGVSYSQVREGIAEHSGVPLDLVPRFKMKPLLKLKMDAWGLNYAKDGWRYRKTSPTLSKDVVEGLKLSYRLLCSYRGGFVFLDPHLTLISSRLDALGSSLPSRMVRRVTSLRARYLWRHAPYYPRIIDTRARVTNPDIQNVWPYNGTLGDIFLDEFEAEMDDLFSFMVEQMKLNYCLESETDFLIHLVQSQTSDNGHLALEKNRYLAALSLKDESAISKIEMSLAQHAKGQIFLEAVSGLSE